MCRNVERRAGKIIPEKISAGNPQLLHDETIGLNELGINRTQSHRWQAIASVPEDDFEEHIVKTKKDLTLPRKSVF